jgi:hypothetical protein
MIPSKLNRHADRFLIAFLNRPAEWLIRRKRFAKLLPREPRQFLSEPDLSGAALMAKRVEHWQGPLRGAWIKKRETQRQAATTQLVAVYGAMAFLSPGEVGSVIKGFGQALTRMAQHGTTQTGLKADAFLQVLHRARETAGRMRKCANPDCEHPFFIARRRTDINCSPECGRVGKNTANLKWWRQQGRDWRASHQRKSKIMTKKRGVKHAEKGK